MNDFWKKAMLCKHDDLNPNYFVTFLCETPGCIVEETHCLKCGIFLTKCNCGYNTWMSGWSRKRWINYWKKLDKS